MSTTPTHIGKYEILRLLGQGAMGEVYLGQDPLLGRAVAIKVMKNAGEEERQRFLHEARIVGTLSHPRIVVLHDFALHEGRPYIVMEYLVGEDLQAWLKTPRSLADELRIVEGLLSALAYAHAHGVVHRDIKPANVHVTPDGECKLMDFGIARSEEVRMTATGVIMGTPSYMAPEVLESAEYSVAGDVFAVGVVLYEMFAGQNPFLGKGLAATVTNVLTVHPMPLAEARPDLPPALATAVMACLEKDPRRRPGDVSALLGVVSRLRAGIPEPPPARSAADAEPTRLIQPPAPSSVIRQPPARRARTLAVLGVLLGLATAWALWQVTSRAPAPREASVTPAPPATLSARVPAPSATPAASPTARSPEPPSPTPVPSPSRPAPDRRRTPAVATAPPNLGAPPAAAPSAEVPSPSPVAVVSLPSPPAAPPLAASAAPSPAPAAAALGEIAPRSARRGSSLTVELRGSGLRADHRARFLRGRLEANGIRVVRQALLGPTLLRLTVLLDEDVALGTYVVALVDGAGRATNGLAFEVIL